MIKMMCVIVIVVCLRLRLSLWLYHACVSVFLLAYNVYLYEDGDDQCVIHALVYAIAADPLRSVGREWCTFVVVIVCFILVVVVGVVAVSLVPADGSVLRAGVVEALYLSQHAYQHRISFGVRGKATARTGVVGERANGCLPFCVYYTISLFTAWWTKHWDTYAHACTRI